MRTVTLSRWTTTTELWSTTTQHGTTVWREMPKALLPEYDVPLNTHVSCSYLCSPTRISEPDRFLDLDKENLIVINADIDGKEKDSQLTYEHGTPLTVPPLQSRDYPTYGEISWSTLLGRRRSRTETMTGSSRKVFWTSGTSCLKPTSAEAKTIFCF